MMVSIFLKTEIKSSWFMSCIIIKDVLTPYVKYNFPFSSGLYQACVDVSEKKKLNWLVLRNQAQNLLYCNSL